MKDFVPRGDYVDWAARIQSVADGLAEAEKKTRAEHQAFANQPQQPLCEVPDFVGAMAQRRVKVRMILIQGHIVRVELALLHGDLNKAEESIREAYLLLESLDNKSLMLRLNDLHAELQQHRSGVDSHPTRKASTRNEQPYPSPVEIFSPRGSDGDKQEPLTESPAYIPSSTKKTVTNTYKPSTVMNPAQPRRMITAEQARGFFEKIASANTSAKTSMRSSVSSHSSDEVSKLMNKLKYGAPRRKIAMPTLTRKGDPKTKPAPGGIDSFFKEKFPDMHYSPNVKDYVLSHSEEEQNLRAIKWNVRLPIPSGFPDPWQSAAPHSPGMAALMAQVSIPMGVESPHPMIGGLGVRGMTSPFRRSSHPAPQVSRQADLPSAYRRRSLVTSMSEASSSSARLTSSEDIEPETTDGPALPQLLTSMQPNPHAENLPTSPTERVRRLSVDETHVKPTKRPSLTLPFNVSSARKTAASTPSPLRQSFSASDIEFEKALTKAPPTPPISETTTASTPNSILNDSHISSTGAATFSPSSQAKQSPKPVFVDFKPTFTASSSQTSPNSMEMSPMSDPPPVRQPLTSSNLVQSARRTSSRIPVPSSRSSSGNSTSSASSSSATTALYAPPARSTRRPVRTSSNGTTLSEDICREERREEERKRRDAKTAEKVAKGEYVPWRPKTIVPKKQAGRNGHMTSM